MTLPVPRAGLVISYAYLWADEHRRGEEEGRKVRPCAIIAATQVIEDKIVVTVVPVTHTVPRDPTTAIELPAALKAHLGLDAQRSWVVVTETNDFIWPGFDLRPVTSGGQRRYDYGMLPPRFFAHLRGRILQMLQERRLNRVPRDLK